jgi:hypothetical protein
VAVVWVFLLWWERATFRRAALGGALIGLCMLTRENGSILLVSIGLLLLFEKRWETRVWAGYLVIAALTVAFVLPWTVKNWVKFHALVPVAAIVGVDFVEGNNECVAAEGIFIPYWAEGPCAEADKELRPLLADGRFDPRTPAAVRLDQASKRVALRFVVEHPSWYAKLAIRRLWTTLLPYDPRGSQRRHERLVLTAYWLLVYPAGMMGLLRAPKGPAAKFLVLLICLSLASIMAVLYWSDLRFRVGIDLLLGCFAGWAWMQVVVGRRPKPLAIERV